MRTLIKLAQPNINEQECIIRFKKSRRRLEFLNLIIDDGEFFDRLQNLWSV